MLGTSFLHLGWLLGVIRNGRVRGDGATEEWNEVFIGRRQALARDTARLEAVVHAQWCSLGWIWSFHTDPHTAADQHGTEVEERMLGTSRFSCPRSVADGHEGS